MPFLDKMNLVVARVDERQWRLMAPLRYQGRDDMIVVPAGYVTDYASVPRSLQWLAPSTGRYTLAAVLHDYLCDHMINGYAGIPTGSGRLDAGGWKIFISAADADGLFRRVMREEGVRPVQRWLLWAGCRLGAIRNPHRRPGTLRDVPVLCGLAVLAAPFVLPPLVCIGVARAVYAVAEWLTGWFSEEAA